MAIILAIHLPPGYFNGDNYSDLAIGTPAASVNNVKGAGLVQIVYGASTGLIRPARCHDGSHAHRWLQLRREHHQRRLQWRRFHRHFGWHSSPSIWNDCQCGAVQTDYGSTTGI